MIENLSYPVPTIGRIAIGEMFENDNNKRLPKKLNHFKITALYKKNGQWVEHPVAKAVAKAGGVESDKITEIPVKVMFNDPDLTIRERYEAFDKVGMTVCAGNGKTAKRVVGHKIESVDCPGSDVCAFARDVRCALFARANFQIDVDAEGYVPDEMSSFILRSRGYNTARSLNRKLHNIASLFGNRLIGVPMKLKLRSKSSVKSCNTPFYFVDLVLAAPLKEAMKIAKETEEEMMALGFDQKAYEDSVRKGIMNGPFEDSIEELGEVEEFITEDDGLQAGGKTPVSHNVMPEGAAESMESLRKALAHLPATGAAESVPVAA